MRRTRFSGVKDTKFYASILHIKIETSSIKSLNCFLVFVVKYFHVAPFFMQRRAVWMALNFLSQPHITSKSFLILFFFIRRVPFAALLEKYFFSFLHLKVFTIFCLFSSTFKSQTKVLRGNPKKGKSFEDKGKLRSFPLVNNFFVNIHISFRTRKRKRKIFTTF